MTIPLTAVALSALAAVEHNELDTAAMEAVEYTAAAAAAAAAVAAVDSAVAAQPGSNEDMSGSSSSASSSSSETSEDDETAAENGQVSVEDDEGCARLGLGGGGVLEHAQ